MRSMAAEVPKLELEEVIARQDWPALRRIARAQSAKTVRFLVSRLYTPEDANRQKVIQALEEIAGDPEIFSEGKLRELLRRFFWWLSDESGAVPFGIPEAIGAVLKARPELQPDFLPLICSMAHDPEVFQTGSIERGVFWALGHIGRPAALCSPDAVKTVADAAQHHPDPDTRATATWALGRMEAIEPGN
ncbi:MAG: DVU0298 family protein [Candidatus Korobacteraceae bacterium]